MIIVAGGDSFVYGSELQSPDNTFTALLSKDHEYDCVAWPGIGNDGIARRVISCVQGYLPEKPFVIVNWTFPGRYEFKFTYDTMQRTRDWYSITPWTTKDAVEIEQEFISKNTSILAEHSKTTNRAKATGVHEFAKTFYQHVGIGEYWEVYSTLKEITYLQNYLKANNIGYLFTCADNSIWYNYTIQHADTTIHSLTEQIHYDQDRWFWFPAGSLDNETKQPRGFYQWAVENKYPIGTTHPLEQAHRAAADLLKEKFNELVTQSSKSN
jgi:hypothetical protein